MKNKTELERKELNNKNKYPALSSWQKYELEKWSREHKSPFFWPWQC